MSLKKNIEYFYEWFKIDMKQNWEYKTNMIFSTMITITNTIVTLFVLIVLKNQLGDEFLWGMEEFIFFSLQIFFISVFGGIFSYSKKLKKYLIEGKLNEYLIRPLSTQLQYFFQTSRTRRFYVAILYFIALVYYVFSLKVNFVKFCIVFILSLVGITAFLVIIFFIDSWAFFVKESYTLLSIYKNTYSFFRVYPFSFFEDLRYASVLLIFPVTFYGSILTDYLFGYKTINDVVGYLYYIIAIIIVFSIGTYINWHFGLKKYEAYG